MLSERNPAQAEPKFWFSSQSEICLHSFQYRTGQMDCLPHTHDEYNIAFCLKPELEYSLRGRVEQLAPGDVLVVNPGELHRGRYGSAGASARGLTIHIPVRTLKDILAKMHFPADLENNRVLFLEKVSDPSLVPLVEELIREIDRRQSGYEMIVDSIVLQILVHLFRHLLRPSFDRAGPAEPRQLRSWQIVRAMEYMNAHGKNKFNLSELCAEIGTSASRFIQLFKNSVSSMSPHVYYNRLIIEKAQKMLLGSDLAIKEISYELGFQNESHFCKLFRACSGTTPGNFRDQSYAIDSDTADPARIPD
jgi:AraC-like DNA-binding protein